jgi:hypothetical protein
MSKVIKMNLLRDNSPLIYKLRNKELLIYEDVQGSKIYVTYNNGFEIRPKSYKNDPLNFIDLATQKYYNKAFEYLNNLSEDIINLIDNKWQYCFEYFPDNQPANIEYNRTPKNNLILTSIVKNNKHCYNIEEIKEYAKLFNVDSLPIIFKGKLNNKQLEILILFLNTSPEDLEYVFNETNFAKFFYNLLNPNIKNSFLMNYGDFNENLEKIIFKLDNNDKFSFEFLNPTYKDMSENNSTEYIQIYSLILLNFIEFCQLNGLNKYKPSNITKDKLYVDLICLIFNDYLDNVKEDLLKWDFTIPSFFINDKFKVNPNFITNQKTKDYIQSNIKLEYIFKVILNSFNNKKKKPIGIFTEDTLIIFNKLVDTIDNYLDTLLKINIEYIDNKGNLLNFNDFFKLAYNVDSEGRIYLDNEKIKPEEEKYKKGDIKKEKGKK